ncbi:p-loop containing nucleoside triphosphate hydrolase protein [Diplodia corticola]|uniref:p-loop containing nucleoside triphosphate hydrolase protein n=1 Tax=Diplodia corticola TaxID=236234 RepID=A0A1J9R0X1_9PEZI|nr:p-loop containing nucleoside triphosphate hydrolase protein [Diplodia corticola]OJD33890.1 p-loop containing nucleoside triphosphate hydrolase protein [Diplodia corticola]
MPQEATTPTPTDSSNSIFATYHAHASSPRTSTDAQQINKGSSQYDGATATATATLRSGGPPLLRTRAYDPPARRSWQASAGGGGEEGEVGGGGTLRDVVAFGVYDYVWRGGGVCGVCTYVAEGQGSMVSEPEVRFYVVEEEGQGATDGLLLAAHRWAEQSHGDEVWVFDQGRWRKDEELLDDAVRDVELDDIVLEPGTKDAILRDVVGFFGAREQYARFGTPWKRGLIFHGPPGNGKTVTVKAIMKMLMARPDPVPTLYVNAFAQRGSGPQQSVRQIFVKARRTAPCLLLFEDVDSLVKDEVRSYFLNEIDGLENNHGILMIGSTNHLDNLDPGLSKRPSRFDRKYRFRSPSLEERIRYCDWWRAKFADNPDLAVDADTSKRIAELTDGFSFAYLKEAWVASLLSLLYATSSAGTTEASGKLPKMLEKQIEVLKEEMSDVGDKDQEKNKTETKT